MTKASSGCHLWCAHFVCHTLEGVWLLALPKADCNKSDREVECLPLNCFQFYPSRSSSNDMSMVGWSLVKLATALLHLFHANRWKLLWYMLASFRKTGFACYSLLSVAFIVKMTLILFRHLGGATLFWVVRCLSIMLQGFHSHILVTQDPLCELSLVR
jgi:hypothetical protein